MRTLYRKYVDGTGKLSDVPLLLFRLILAVGFFGPAVMKIRNLEGVAEWFGSMNYPFPLISASLAMVTEVAGIILLILGFRTRIIAIPLIFIMLVAIFTVHSSHGFAAGDNGYEIPLYYLLMLFALVVHGSGRYSLDHLLEISPRGRRAAA